MPKRSDTYRILVVGAGPVGLLFARLLHEAGHGRFHLRVIDTKPPPSWRAAEMDARVYALSRESQWLLAAEWPVLASHRICPYRRMRVFEGETPEGHAAVSFDAAEIGEPDLGHIVEDRLIRKAVLEQLERRGVETAFGLEVDALEFHHPGVTVRFAGGASDEADLVVGADGADSRVRSAAGIEVLRKAYAQRAIVTHVESEQRHDATAWQRFLPGGPLAFLPLADGRSSVVWTNQDAEAARRLALPETMFLQELEAASAGVLGRLGPCTARLAFPLELKHALHYARAGVVLIGDAAHTVHPLAGQGVNLGLRDAAVLARTLEVAVDSGEYPGDEFVLRRYARAQRAHNLSMQFAFDALNSLFGAARPSWFRPLRSLGMAAVDAAEPVKRMLMRRALGLYTLGPGSVGNEAA
jgi:2-octaprenylphenol hydroxylase